MKLPETEKIKVRGLACLAAAIFGCWGGLIALKGLYDLFIGEPEANLYSAVPWTFVTQEAWLRYGGFEVAYGLACLALGWAVLRYGRFLPETLERARREPKFELFD
ncbi:MAG: hypothetical protein HY748_17435 [Elusimicrobia bacterium]|nr:hypothetical protein [Elusimicrobiota bacterium]